MFFVVVGCGRIGSNLARTLMQENHDVVVIDSDASKFEALGSGFNGVTIAGIPIDEDVLRSAGIERADALAAVTSKDNLNVMVSQIASEMFHVPRVITRIADQQRETLFRRMGMVTLCPTVLAVGQIKDLLLSSGKDRYCEFNGTGLHFRQVRPAKRQLGKPLVDYPDGHGFALIRDGNLLLMSPKLCIADGDTVIVVDYAE